MEYLKIVSCISVFCVQFSLCNVAILLLLYCYLDLAINYICKQPLKHVQHEFYNSMVLNIEGT